MADVQAQRYRKGLFSHRVALVDRPVSARQAFAALTTAWHAEPVLPPGAPLAATVAVPPSAPHLLRRGGRGKNGWGDLFLPIFVALIDLRLSRAKRLPREGKISHALEADPNRLRARRAIAFTSQVTTERR
mgnify:FL=1